MEVKQETPKTKQVVGNHDLEVARAKRLAMERGQRRKSSTKMRLSKK